MGRNKGVCAICGKGGKLSFEHLPPECAYNERGGREYTFEEWHEAGFPRSAEGLAGKGRPVPEGTGAATLCVECNSHLTGTHYVPSYCAWVQRCAGVLGKLGDLQQLDASTAYTSVEVEMSAIYPLRIIKEIVAILLALNAQGNPRFRQRHPELVRFVLDKERSGLSARYHVYAVLFGGPLARFVPVSLKGDPRGYWYVTALDHWPVAHVLTLDEQEITPLLAAGEITNFADCSLDQKATWRGDLPVGFGHLPFPVDYRTAGMIAADELRGGRDRWFHMDDPEEGGP